MDENEKPTYEELAAMVIKLEAAVNTLRRHLHQATDALLQQEIENEILKSK